MLLLSLVFIIVAVVYMVRCDSPGAVITSAQADRQNTLNQSKSNLGFNSHNSCANADMSSISTLSTIDTFEYTHSYTHSFDDFVLASNDSTTNPATGLPMIGGVAGLDVVGNPYGASSTSDDFFQNDTFNSGSISSFDDY